MSLIFVKGDPLLTKAAVLAIGHNAKGRTDMSDFSLTFTHSDALIPKICTNSL
ncbi:MAG: hypothetical protein Q9P44_17100 [Anaerolineae bacterium]|nr:hypothetical protein [Anaerolineae bacterium]